MERSNFLPQSMGIILLDKAYGVSSNTAMQRIRRGLTIKKMGHTGTLDPLATGMLPLCFGQATKLCSYFLEADKTYQTRISLGEQRSTGDQEGEIIKTQAVPELNQENLENILKNFIGPQTQIPPMYSALKKDGKALYQLAREGIEIEREARNINILKINLLGFKTSPELNNLDNYLDLEITCSTGTYIRTLGEDIAKALGTVGYLSSLRRVSCANFKESEMHTEQEILENLNNLNGPENLKKYVLSPEQALGWPVLELSEEIFIKLLQGKNPEFYIPENMPNGMVFLAGADAEIVSPLAGETDQETFGRLGREGAEIKAFGEIGPDLTQDPASGARILKWRTFLI